MDAATGSGSHTGADIARGAQGGEGGLLGPRVGVVRAERSASSGFMRFRFSAQGRRGVRGTEGVGRRARDGVSELRLREARLFGIDARAVREVAGVWLRQGAGECSRAADADPYERRVLRGRVSM